MLGRELKISPVLQKDMKEGDKYSVYFPKGIWYNLNDWSIINATVPKYFELQASFDYTNVHMRDGTMVIYYDNSANQLMTTHDILYKGKMTLIVARKKVTTAAYDGYILIDDGHSYMEMNPENMGKSENFQLR